jgi:hypothetical protein
MIEHASADSLQSLSKFAIQWLQGRSRPSETGKTQRISALHRVIAATRETQRYCTSRDHGRADPHKEEQLASMWIDLSFRLEGVGVKKLA